MYLAFSGVEIPDTIFLAVVGDDAVSSAWSAMAMPNSASLVTGGDC